MHARRHGGSSGDVVAEAGIEHGRYAIRCDSGVQRADIAVNTLAGIAGRVKKLKSD